MKKSGVKKNNLSVGILARPSEISTVVKKLIPKLSWSDDLVIVIDNSLGEDKNYFFPKGVKVYFRRLKDDYAAQRNFLLRKTKNDWVFFIDPDERFNSKFIKEVFEKINQNRYRGLMIRREEVFLNKRLKYGEGSIWILRIGNKRYGRWEGKVHEKWVIEPKLVGRIKTRITHFGYKNDIKGFLEKNLIYAKIRADELAVKRKSSIALFFLKPIFKFCQNYFWRGGFLDGRPGLIHALCMAFYSLCTEIFILGKFKKSD